MTCRALASSSLGLALALAFAGAVAAPASTYTVDSVLDASDATPGDDVCDDGAGHCTYRAALQEANAHAGPDAVAFDIPAAQCAPGTSVCTLAMGSPPPDIDDPVSIDGSTQPGNAAVCTTAIPARPTYKVVLDGGGVAAPGVRFHARPGFPGASGSTLRGLNVRGFSEGVAISGVDGADISGVTVACNFIGTDESGVAVATNRNGANGVLLVCDAHDNVVGGPQPEDGNLISGNGVGVWILCDSPATTTNANAVLGNFVGTDRSGTVPLGNLYDGVAISGLGGPSLNTIGSTADGATIRGNRIGASGYGGVFIDGPSTTGNVVVGNSIGTDPAGAARLGNALGGVYVHAPGNRIGGTEAGEGNVIAFNGGYAGVAVFSDVDATAVGDEIAGNSLRRNTGIGIDLGDDGATPNDPGDGDSGANLLQNSPSILSTSWNGSGFNVSFSVSSPTPVRVDFYVADEVCQGRLYLGSVTYEGGLTLTPLPAQGADPASRVVATATDPAGNTSEFSPPAGGCSGLFYDDFESGDTIAWNEVVTPP